MKNNIVRVAPPGLILYVEHLFPVRNALLYHLYGYLAELVETQPLPIVKMLEGPSKGIEWVAHWEWLFPSYSSMLPCDCPVNILLAKGCQNKRSHR